MYLGTFEVDSIHKDGYDQEQLEGMGNFEVRVAGKAILEVNELFDEGNHKL